MNYYEHHLGDYLRDTAHLTLIEDAIYRRLLDQYYIREAPLPLSVEEVCKLARIRNDRQRESVEYVLNSFFIREGDGWHQVRADQEIARYNLKKNKARASANARWSPCERNANALPTQCEGNALQSPDTSHKNLLGGSPPEWAAIRAAYPKRQGDHRWPTALKHAQARLREGATWAELLAGVERYAVFVRAEGKEGTPYVKQAATFFGTDRGFRDEWAITKPNGKRSHLPQEVL